MPRFGRSSNCVRPGGASGGREVVGRINRNQTDKSWRGRKLDDTVEPNASSRVVENSRPPRNPTPGMGAGGGSQVGEVGGKRRGGCAERGYVSDERRRGSRELENAVKPNLRQSTSRAWSYAHTCVKPTRQTIKQRRPSLGLKCFFSSSSSFSTRFWCLYRNLMGKKQSNIRLLHVHHAADSNISRNPSRAQQAFAGVMHRMHRIDWEPAKTIR